MCWVLPRGLDVLELRTFFCWLGRWRWVDDVLSFSSRARCFYSITLQIVWYELFAKFWRVQGAAMCGWENHHLRLYYSCPVRDNVDQSYHYQDRRQWSWLSVYTPCVWGSCFMLISCQDTIHMWATWKVCTVQSSVVLLGQEVQESVFFFKIGFESTQLAHRVQPERTQVEVQ